MATTNDMQQTGDQDQFICQSVSSNEVHKVIVEMPSTKAPGNDKLPVSVVKDCLEHILPTLTDIINHSLSSSVFPRAWKRAQWFPTPCAKDGDHEIPNNNRPISLLPVLSKVAARIAMCQFNNYLVQKNRLTSRQSGNRKMHDLGWLTVKELLRLRDTTMINKCLNGLTPSYLSLKLTECSKTYEYNTRNRDQLSLPKCRTAITQRSFFYMAVALWNSRLLVRQETLHLLTVFSGLTVGPRLNAGLV